MTIQTDGFLSTDFVWNACDELRTGVSSIKQFRHPSIKQYQVCGFGGECRYYIRVTFFKFL